MDYVKHVDSALIRFKENKEEGRFKRGPFTNQIEYIEEISPLDPVYLFYA